MSTLLTNATQEQQRKIVSNALETVRQGGHTNIVDVISEVKNDCAALGITTEEILYFLLLDPLFAKIKVSV